MEYIGTGFNQVQATVKFNPCNGGHSHFMQIKHISATWIFLNRHRNVSRKNLYLEVVPDPRSGKNTNIFS